LPISTKNFVIAFAFFTGFVAHHDRAPFYNFMTATRVFSFLLVRT